METEITQVEQEDQGTGMVVPQTFEFLDGLWRKLPQPIADLTTGMHYDSQAKYVSWRIPQFDQFDHIELLHITDVQFGHRECRYDRVVEYRDWIMEQPNRFMLWGGDMIDAWALYSPGMPWDQIMGPDSQVFRFCELWAPAQNRILGYVGGNHERRAMKAFGDLGILIASMLKIPYSDGRQIIDIEYGRHNPFKVSLWHGRGAARTKGTIANVLYNFMQQGDAQLYLMGHLHQAVILPDWREVRERGRRRVRLEKIIGAIGTSFLETWGTYGEVAGYKPGDVMMARAVVEADGHWEVTLR
jgi:hypothetical protein